jgi:parallel beta-helix repeat protein
MGKGKQVAADPPLTPGVLRVSRYGAIRSISEAAEKASDGDQIVVDPGIYTLGKNREKFPIYIPPRCQLIGLGADKCFIDGGNDREIVERPIHPYQSLVLLGDEATISGFTIQNSGGNGVSSEQGARVVITKNSIRDNAQHGILVFGTNSAMIQDNQFFNNGKAKSKFGGPRPGIGKQGHHIYIEGRTDCTNDVMIIGNMMEKVFADAIANDMYDQADGLAMRLQIVGNVITDCGRNGMSIVSSYGPSGTDVFVHILNNRILRTPGNAIDLVVTYSLVNRSISDAKLVANVLKNEISECGCGILAVGAYEASENCKARYSIIKNRVEKAKDYGIRVVGGYNLGNLPGWAVQNTVVEAVVADNNISDCKKTPVLIQGGTREKRGVVKDNTVYLHIVANEVIENGKKKKPGNGIIIRNGVPISNNNIVLVA